MLCKVHFVRDEYTRYFSACQQGYMQKCQPFTWSDPKKCDML